MTEQPAQLGEVIGGYQLQNILGQGGMGCVYEAIHTRLGRRTALKLLAPSLVSSDEYVSRFLSEAKIVNDVRHPNIVDIYDFIELSEPRRVAYVMELVEGPSLGQALKAQRMSLTQAINVTFQLVSALEAVHGLGVIHRDLKPDNVLVLGDLEGDLSSVPSVKILDFGIAKTTDADVQHKTITGSMLGTPSYMAPEQIAANPVSAATDIYAIGEIFYEMVSGERLFKGDRMRMLSSKLLGEVPELVLPADVPSADSVKELVRWCLCLDPEERPSIPELANALSELLAISTDTRPVPLARTAVSRPPPREEVVENTAAAAMASAISLPAPASSRGTLFAIAGVALLAIGIGVAVFAGQAAPDQVEAIPLTPVVTKALEVPPPSAPIVVPVESKPETKPEAPPVVAEEPAKPAPATKPKHKRRRTRRSEPKATPAPKKPNRVVKKRELVPW